MKYLVSLIIAVGVAVFAQPLTVSAASFVITPASGSYTVGDTVTATIAVDPAGKSIYTALFDAKFTPGAIEVLSFSMNGAMVPMTMSGYDTLNNTAGVITKTGGYIGGASTKQSFGTIVFRVKTAGTATFSVQNSTSKLLDSNDANALTGGAVATYTVVAKAVATTAPTPAATTAPVAKKATTGAAAVTATQDDTATILDTEITEADKPSLLENIIQYFLAQSATTVTLLIIVVLETSALIMCYRSRKKMK